jgi:hypothetical protein
MVLIQFELVIEKVHWCAPTLQDYIFMHSVATTYREKSAAVAGLL